jgi:mRNA interferase MazF
VNLDPAVGAEITKRRPAVVVSHDEMNTRLQTVVVCPLTSRIHGRWSTRVQTSATGLRAEVAVDQIGTVSRNRLRDPIGTLSVAEAQPVRHVITAMYGVLSVAVGEAR